MEHPTNDNLPRLFYWISDNWALWQKLCRQPEMGKDDFIDILQSLREAGLYQIALVLLVNASHRGFLYKALQDIMLRWCEEQMTAEAIDDFIGLLLNKLEADEPLNERD